ncbi:glutamate racemase [Rubidibacter lacunae KORDI 51-2]|uniref:Glutamate racemase n=1 Tax=Rubidibacter lacunae KORDI 51-2 TaxID=582515 RepID=U5DH30_9CHRO|nr:glutamate racemase [Rubidibacter lacunae]ERN40562.1 glutamate racemase [Rubidibacter lacunae KORDI 51-2]
MEFSAAPIGIFDSGVGGLTVWLELTRQLPCESVVYFGDTARLPYGTRSPDEICIYVREILTWLQLQGVKMVLMACNTSSALAQDLVRTEFPDLPVLGLILPGARAAVTTGRRIGAIATLATVASGAYRRAIAEIDPLAEVWEVACPEFVPLIESGRLHDPQLIAAAERYLAPLRRQQIDTLVYGCTHYPLIASVVRNLLPPTVTGIDPARYLVAAAERELEALGLKRSGAPQATRFCVSGSSQQFTCLARQWLGFEPPVESILLPQIPASVPLESLD